MKFNDIYYIRSYNITGRTIIDGRKKFKVSLIYNL